MCIDALENAVEVLAHSWRTGFLAPARPWCDHWLEHVNREHNADADEWAGRSRQERAGLVEVSPELPALGAWVAGVLAYFDGSAKGGIAACAIILRLVLPPSSGAEPQAHGLRYTFAALPAPGARQGYFVGPSGKHDRFRTAVDNSAGVDV